MEKTWPVKEQELRKQIADEITKKMMPICVCERCNNLFEGALVQKAIDIVRGQK